MPNASFVQASFLGGEWSSYSQGRVDSDKYKIAMNRCLNGYPLEEGSWTRRQGTRLVAHTKGGNAARLIGFNFSVDLTFQMELGPLYARFFLGPTQVFTLDQQAIVSISTATPAVVTTYGVHGWSTGNAVMFQFDDGISGQNNNGPLLRNRQFVMTSTGASTFTLADALTNAAVDGSTLGYTAPGGKVKRISEIVTVYAGTSWKNTRMVPNEDNITLLNSAYAPQAVLLNSTTTVFTISTIDFIDGPYLDANSTTTTMTPSAVSGSITVTASAVTGINGGIGFQTRDINRLMRFFWEPAAWSSASTYVLGSLVKYNDQYFVNVKAVTVATTVTPERDLTSWAFATDAAFWTWGKITARTSTTVVTVLIKGDPFTDTTARLIWRLGLYSDQTGWPTVGSYKDGRLWLSGVVKNRVDGSMSNNNDIGFTGVSLYFAPTLKDGTVADNNAIAALANSDDRNSAAWMTSDEDGLYMGTAGGEWRGRASVNNDSIAPTNFDLRRVSKNQCSNAEPVHAVDRILFIQRQRRKLIEWGNPQDGYHGTHLSITGRHLTKSGLEELAFQREPVPMIWARRTDGGLIGCAYKRDPETGFHAAWHEVNLGKDRTCVSVSSGASLSGLSEALWLVSKGTTDTSHFVEILNPIFEDDTENWASWYVDAGFPPTAAKIVGSTIQFNGFWPHNGTTVDVMVGGIDGGTYTVTNGEVDVPYTADITLAALQGLSAAGPIYRDFMVTIDGGPRTATFTAGSFVANIGPDASVVSHSSNCIITDPERNRVYNLKEGAGATDGIRIFDLHTDGAETFQANNAVIFGPANNGAKNVVTNGGGAAALDDAGYLYICNTGGNSRGVSKLNPTTLKEIASFGAPSAQLQPTNGLGLVAPVSFCCVRNTAGYDFLVSGSFQTEISVVLTNSMTFAGFAANVDEGLVVVCAGAKNSGTAWALGKPSASPSAAALGIYKIQMASDAQNWQPPPDMTTWATVPNTSITKTKMGTITPAQVDATWASFDNVTGMAYDRTDGNLIIQASRLGVYYVIKVNSSNAAVMWKVAVNANDPYGDSTMNRHNITNSVLCILSGTATAGSDYPIYEINTSAGTLTSSNIWRGGGLFGGQIYDGYTGSVVWHGTFVKGVAGTNPTTFAGAYFAAHVGSENYINQQGRYYPKNSQTQVSDGTTYLRVFYTIPSVVGYTYKSRGQLLRPDSGNDAGAANGPAFGKIRRVHKYAASLLKTRGITFGSGFDASQMNAPLGADDGVALAAGALYTGIARDTLDCPTNTEGQIAWEIVRPYPATVLAVAGYLETQDE